MLIVQVLVDDVVLYNVIGGTVRNVGIRRRRDRLSGGRGKREVRRRRVGLLGALMVENVLINDVMFQNVVALPVWSVCSICDNSN